MTDWLQHCKIASTPADGNITIATPPTTIDSVSLASLVVNTDRVVLMHQNTPSQNTTYTYNGTSLVATADVLAPQVMLRVDQGATLAHTEHALKDTTGYQWVRQILRANARDFGATGMRQQQVPNHA